MASIRCRGDGVGQSSGQRPALRRWRRILVTLALLPVAVHCEASTLARQLNDLIRAPITLVSGSQKKVTSALGDFLTPYIQRLAIRGIDFPVTSTTPGIVYQWDQDLGTWTPVRSLGPVFAERARTLGARKFEVGAFLLYGDLDEVDGGPFGTTSKDVHTSELNHQGLDVCYACDIKSFHLRQLSLNLSSTYGLADGWDLNVLLPIVHTELAVRARRVVDVLTKHPQPPLDPDQDFLGGQEVPASLNAGAWGVGDLLLRTKYVLLRAGKPRPQPIIATGLALRIPTGNSENFQGLGDVTVTPFMVGSYLIGRNEIHANVGVELNAGDISSTRMRYAIGVALQPFDAVAAFLDVIGSSGLQSEQFPVGKGAGAVTAPSSAPNTLCQGDVNFGSIPRSDLVDLAMGFKVHFLRAGTAFVGAIVPLTKDGLRADVVPTGGVEVAF